MVGRPERGGAWSKRRHRTGRGQKMGNLKNNNNNKDKGLKPSPGHNSHFKTSILRLTSLS